MKKLHNKDFSIAVKTGSDANKSKFTKEAVKGEAYYATDSQNLYFAQSTAGVSDALLSKLEPSELAYGNNYSMSFDGSNDFLSIGNLSTLSSATSFSVSIWVNLSNWDGSVTYALLTSGTGNSDRVCFYLNSLNEVRFGVNASVGTCLFNLSTPVDYRNAGWHHVVGAYNGTNVTLFFDGSQVSTTTSNVPSTTSSTIGNNAIIAGETWSSSRYFSGLIDEVAVFNSELSASDVTAIYNGGTPASISSLNPVGWWRMGDDPKDSATSGGSVATITDSSGNGNHATQSTAASQPTFKALDKSTTSISFDGSDDSFAFTGSAGIQLDQIFSASCWIKVNTITSDPRGVITWGEAANGKGRGIFISNATVGLFGYTNSYNQMTTSFISTNTWYHVAVTYDGTTANVYLNGALDSTRNFSLISFTYSQTHIGELYYSQTTPARHFDGYMDDLALFNTALSASDVASLATFRGAHIINDLSLSPVAYYRMGEDDGLTDGQTGISQITDASENGNHATQSTAASQPTASVSPAIYF